MQNHHPSPEELGLVRVRLDIAYDGGPFSGWAIQPGLQTLQGTLEEALALIMRRLVRLTVAGRTDTGVHARGQVAHCDFTQAEWDGLNRDNTVEPCLALLRRINGALGWVLKDSQGAIQIQRVQRAGHGFDARFSALWRRYSYRIADASTKRDPLLRTQTLWFNQDLDADLMDAGAAELLGLGDFKAFAKPREGSTTVRTLQRFDFTRGDDGVINLNIQADAFCHNMVRALTGAALRVGQGMEGPHWMRERQLAGVRDAKSVLASAHPLIFEEVRYPDAAELHERATLTRTRRAPVTAFGTPL
ncbi:MULTISPECIES: tRNA pseudouridine synthase A [Arthrobacter]|uniref:tRNA pseudouridine synthase A n=1 Tax=Arthrobacter psychrochitiniphilus TaxID=291045 RepID=A0A2V3DT55_9MICC|nr:MULTISPECIES: tRNA pseudouridine synthase A [Arthrobacter]NYG18667.1 tRNA pseudouridine38-40 synthase [Arthrobacter psychrochitiniphilus]PXA66396.1 tRNA pseudouridine(38-40) synthase TruA [Arthrobacter psychrochitiniphilus]